jgi:hypothetical protein
MEMSLLVLEKNYRLAFIITKLKKHCSARYCCHLPISNRSKSLRFQSILNHTQSSGYLAFVLSVPDAKLLAHLADWWPVDVMRTQQEPIILMDATDHHLLDNHRIQWVDDNRRLIMRRIVTPSSFNAATGSARGFLDAPPRPVLDAFLYLNAHVSQYQVITSP